MPRSIRASDKTNNIQQKTKLAYYYDACMHVTVTVFSITLGTAVLCSLRAGS